MSDFYFVASTHKQQQLYSRAGGNTQYLYRFSYRAAHRKNREWQGAVTLIVWIVTFSLLFTINSISASATGLSY